MLLIAPNDNAKAFTFHYVSIKTIKLLYNEIRKMLFTFHYVSIKTIAADMSVSPAQVFTFHYVSIKTRGLK